MKPLKLSRFLFITVLCYFIGLSSVNCQTAIVSATNVVITKDTISAQNNYTLYFKTNIQNVENLKSIDFSIFNQAGVKIKQYDSYQLKTHPNNFYYLEGINTNEKITVMGNSAFFIKSLDPLLYGDSWSLQINYTLITNLTNTITYSISK